MPRSSRNVRADLRWVLRRAGATALRATDWRQKFAGLKHKHTGGFALAVLDLAGGDDQT